MSDFADFTDFQIVFTAESVNNYSPRPQIEFSYFTDFQPVFLATSADTHIDIPQYNNYYNIRDLKYANSINLNPTLNINIQSVLDLYSGTVGKTIFNISELKSMVTAYPTKIQLSYLESFETIPVEDNLTNLVFADIVGNNKHFRIYTKEYIK
jgi:hypothetical protein